METSGAAAAASLVLAAYVAAARSLVTGVLVRSRAAAGRCCRGGRGGRSGEEREARGELQGQRGRQQGREQRGGDLKSTEARGAALAAGEFEEATTKKKETRRRGDKLKGPTCSRSTHHRPLYILQLLLNMIDAGRPRDAISMAMSAVVDQTEWIRYGKRRRMA